MFDQLDITPLLAPPLTQGLISPYSYLKEIISTNIKHRCDVAPFAPNLGVRLRQPVGNLVDHVVRHISRLKAAGF
jgi:hypothetical protein